MQLLEYAFISFCLTALFWAVNVYYTPRHLIYACRPGCYEQMLGRIHRNTEATLCNTTKIVDGMFPTIDWLVSTNLELTHDRDSKECDG